MPKVVKFHEDDGGSGADVARVRYSREALAAQRAQLPMFQVRHDVVAEILAHSVSVIVGETGSGKSTQLPQALLELDPKQNIVVSQPRRVAATSLAQRVADEAGCAVGSRVGYNVRFDAKTSPATRIRYVTDGMLLREFMLDPLLSRYTTVVVDEAHERTVTSDLVLGLLKQLLVRRNAGAAAAGAAAGAAGSSRSRLHPLRVVVMSATLDAQRFADFFGAETTSQLYVPGRAFGVERFYTRQPVSSLVDAMVQTVVQINRGEPGGGDILCFLPGQEEIETCCEMLRDAGERERERSKSERKSERKSGGGGGNAPRLVVVPLYAALPEAEQQRAFAPVRAPLERKVVLATNIAETSVTIPGIAYVVDSGIRKVRVHRAVLGLESLLPAAISQASAAQRMGRAGRERAGKCWRLYTEQFYASEMQLATEPEISRVSLALPVLMLKRIGVADVHGFPWLDRPSAAALRNALLQLLTLRALDQQSGKITSFGLQMAALPLDPPLSAVLVSAHTEAPRRIREATLDVAACLSVQDLLVTPSSARREEVTSRRQELFPAASQFGDLVLVKLIYDAYQSIAKEDLRDWCWSIGVSARALKKVALVRKQLVGYLTAGSRNSGASGTDGTDGASGTSGASSSRTAATKTKFDSDADSDSDSDSDKKLSTDDYEQLIRTFLRGYISNTAIALPDRRFQTVMTQQPVSIHPGSSLFGARPEAIMYLEYVYTSRGYARFVSPITVEWLREFAPQLLARAVTTQEV